MPARLGEGATSRGAVDTATKHDRLDDAEAVSENDRLMTYALTTFRDSPKFQAGSFRSFLIPQPATRPGERVSFVEIPGENDSFTVKLTYRIGNQFGGRAEPNDFAHESILVGPRTLEVGQTNRDEDGRVIGTRVGTLDRFDHGYAHIDYTLNGRPVERNAREAAQGFEDIINDYREIEVATPAQPEGSQTPETDF